MPTRRKDTGDPRREAGALGCDRPCHLPLPTIVFKLAQPFDALSIPVFQLSMSGHDDCRGVLWSCGVSRSIGIAGICGIMPEHTATGPKALRGSQRKIYSRAPSPLEAG